jgi:SAM-dependent methyltransferase
VKQNIFDNEDFFTRYDTYRNSPECINSVIEQPALRRALPDLTNLRVLDVGCGAGEFCDYALQQGASFVLGVDISRRMVAKAAARLAHNANAAIVNKAIEDFAWDGEPFDVITSSLTLHYVERLGDVFKRLSSWLRRGGIFLMSVNHPVYTANLGQSSIVGTSQTRLIQNYWNEDIRVHEWFVPGVIKYHRTLETYVELLKANGFNLTDIYEPSPKSTGITHWEGDPQLADRPIFILFKAEKA